MATYKGHIEDASGNLLLPISPDVAPVQTSTTASQSYAVGDYFYYNNTFYRVTSAISSGGTISPGTNCTATTVGAELKSVNSRINDPLIANWTLLGSITYGNSETYSISAYSFLAFVPKNYPSGSNFIAASGPVIAPISVFQNYGGVHLPNVQKAVTFTSITSSSITVKNGGTASYPYTIDVYAC